MTKSEYLIKASEKREMFSDLSGNKIKVGDCNDSTGGKHAFFADFTVYHVVRNDKCEVEKTEKAAVIEGVWIDSDNLKMPLYMCYIQTLYVEPNFRYKGLGKFIFDNLGKISNHYLNAPIRCAVTYPVNDDEKYLSIMISAIKNNGFIEIEGGYYMKNYAAEDNY